MSRVPLRIYSSLGPRAFLGAANPIATPAVRMVRRYATETPEQKPSTPTPPKPAPVTGGKPGAPAAKSKDPNDEKAEPGSFDDIFRDTTVKDEKNAPPPKLAFPLGLKNPPKPGENTGVTRRSFYQWREDLKDYDKHRAKRRELEKRMFTPYFRDFTRMSKDYRGKSFFAPNRLFKADKALFFPNLQGRTLDGGDKVDTTPLLRGKVSVVAVYSSVWGEKQAMTFLNGLEERTEFKDSPNVQRVDINVEENPAKLLILKWFIPSLRKRIPEDRHNKYFIVSKGITSEMREQTGLWNSKVGYIFLVDAACRIRWAGSGDALPDEKEILAWGLKRLSDEHLKTLEAQAAVSAPSS